jgi:hypothetical protein
MDDLLPKAPFEFRNSDYGFHRDDLAKSETSLSLAGLLFAHSAPLPGTGKGMEFLMLLVIQED